MSDLTTLIANVAQLQADVTVIVTRYDAVLNATENVVINVNAEIAKAAEWAIHPEDVLVPGGNLVDEYSAYHWAQKAEENAASTVAAAADAAAAAASETAAGLSADAAATSESNALSYRNAAQAADTAAGLSATAASNSAGNAASDAAATAADVISTAADAATVAGDKVAAAANASAASGSASTAAGHAGTASSQAALAALWAAEAEDVIVAAGEYSAYHYMKKCQTIEGGLDISNKLGINDQAADSALLNGQAGSYYLAWANITGRPGTFEPAAHTHPMSELSGFTINAPAAGHLLNWSGTAWVNDTPANIGVSEVGHTHTWASLTGKPTTIGASGIADVYTMTEVNNAIATATPAWASLTGVPTTFTPSPHTHVETDITDLDKYTQAQVDAAIAAAVPTWTTLSGKPATFAPSTHTHLWADLTDKPATFAPSAHTHVKSEITDLYDNYMFFGQDTLTTQNLFYAGGLNATFPGFSFDSSDYMGYDRTVDQYAFVIDGVSAATISQKQLFINGALMERTTTITDGPGLTIDPKDGSVQVITLIDDRTPTLSFEEGEPLTLYIMDGTGPFVITWTGVVWQGGSPPDLDPSLYTVVELQKVDGVIYGFLVGYMG